MAAALCAACSGTGDEPPDPASAPVTADDRPDPGFTEVTASTSSEGTVVERPLAEVCPDELVVQLADQPSVEHAPLFALLGTDVTIDEERQSVRASVVRPGDGDDDEVTLEIRAGGPAVDFRPPLELMAADESITFAEASTAAVVIQRPAIAVTSVVTLTERSHEGVIWDPETYPDTTGIGDLAAGGVEIRYLPDEPFIDYLVATGVLAGAALVDESFVEPAAFVAAGGAIAQQGDSLVDPLLLPTLPQWGRPVAFGFAADVGWESYDDTLAVRSDQLDDLAPCLEQWVPLVQRSIVDVAGDPSDTAVILGGLRGLFNPLTRATPELLEAGAAAARESGVIANGPDGTIGSFDPARVERFAASLAEAFALDLGGPDLAVDTFLDPDIAL